MRRELSAILQEHNDGELMKDVPAKRPALIKTKTASGLSLLRMVLTDNGKARISRITRAYTFSFASTDLHSLLFYKALNSFFTSIWGYLSNIFCPEKMQTGPHDLVNPAPTSTFVLPVGPTSNTCRIEEAEKSRN